MKLRYTRRALAELLAAHQWYEEQEPGLGREFLRVFRRLIDSDRGVRDVTQSRIGTVAAGRNPVLPVVLPSEPR